MWTGDRGNGVAGSNSKPQGSWVHSLSTLRGFWFVWSGGRSWSVLAYRKQSLPCLLILSIIRNGHWVQMVTLKFMLKLQFFDQRELQQSQDALSTSEQQWSSFSPESQTLPHSPLWEICSWHHIIPNSGTSISNAENRETPRQMPPSQWGEKFAGSCCEELQSVGL